jgi:cell division GTPase FtsZ
MAIAEIRNYAGTNLNIIHGSTINNDLDGELILTLVATGYHMKKEDVGFGDIKKEFTDNLNKDDMSDVHISLDDEDFDEPSDQESRLEELFASPLTERERKKKAKEEAKRKAQEEKERNRKGIKTTQSTTNTSKLPDWLKK